MRWHWRVVNGTVEIAPDTYAEVTPGEDGWSVESYPGDGEAFDAAMEVVEP